MQILQVEVYSIKELPPAVQQKVINRHRDINIDDEWWDFIYDDFVEIAKHFGFELDPKKIWFSGFGSQGDGACFVTEIEWKDFCKAYALRNHIKKYAPKDEKLIQLWEKTRELVKLMSASRKAGIQIEFVKFGHYCHNYSVTAHMDCGTNLVSEKTANAVKDLVLGVGRNLMDWLYKTLETEYDALTTDEAVMDAIEVNEMLFDKEGRVYRLPKTAIAIPGAGK